MKWKTWFKGLAAVAIGGAATGAAHALGNGQINANTAITAGIGALSTVLAYLAQSPLGAAPVSALPPALAQPWPAAAASPAPASSEPSGNPSR